MKELNCIECLSISGGTTSGEDISSLNFIVGMGAVGGILGAIKLVQNQGMEQGIGKIMLGGVVVGGYSAIIASLGCGISYIIDVATHS